MVQKTRRERGREGKGDDELVEAEKERTDRK
jgi:hypothetical protein